MELHTIHKYRLRSLSCRIILILLYLVPPFLNAQFVVQKKADFFSVTMKDTVGNVIRSRPSIDSIRLSMIDSNIRGISSLIFLKPQYTREKKADFFSAAMKDTISIVTRSKPTIDSVRMFIRDGNITSIGIVDKKDSSYFNWKRNTVSYNLSYAGDRYKLEQEIPALYRLVRDSTFIREILQHEPSNPIGISFNAKNIYCFPFGYGGGRPSPQMRTEFKIELTEKLNKNYRRRKIQTRDSVLILQAIVAGQPIISDEAHLEGPLQLIKGQKDGLYDYFMKTYNDYEKQIAASGAKHKKLYRTYVSFMPVPRGLLEFFVRLNPDNTITFENNGSGRVLRMKGIEQDVDNTILTF